MNRVHLTDQALTPIYELEKLNKKELEIEKPKENTTSETTEEMTSNFVKVIRSSIMRKRVAVCSFLWITCTFVYYGLSINSVFLGGNKYVNFMLVVFVEIPANIVCLLVLDRFGRKRVLIITYVLSACLCIGLYFLPKVPSIALCYLQLPYVILPENAIDINFFLFFGSLALVASFLVLTIPETINVALPDTMKSSF